MAKDNTDTLMMRLPWAGKKVSMERAEEELSHLWRMSADNVRISQNVNVRTSVLNFVICAPDIESARSAGTLLRNLSNTDIARVLLFILDRSSTDSGSVSTWVTLRSFPIISDVMRHNFEQITIYATGQAILATANVIHTLLKPDLPAYLWWIGDLPSDMHNFTRLAQISSRLIVDSNGFFDPETSLAALADFLRAAPQTALSDLNWGRVTPWRELVAQFFDVAEYRTYLTGVNTIEIEHAVTPGTSSTSDQARANPACALLFAGWLKSSLNWQSATSTSQEQQQGSYSWQMSRHTGLLSIHTSAEETQLLTHSGEGTITIRPREQSDLQPGSLCMVRMQSTLDGKRATFTIDREHEADHVETSVVVGDAPPIRRTVSLAINDELVHMLHKELEITRRDELFANVLQEVDSLLEA